MEDYELTKEEAKKLIVLNSRGKVHAVYNIPIGFVGMDRSKKSIFWEIDNAFMLQRAGEQAQKFKHSLAIIPAETCKHSDILFVETKDDLEVTK